MNVKWTLYGHPRNRNLKVIVGYAALNSRASTVLVMIPLYDLLDANHDGQVGWGEWLMPWVPFVGETIQPMAEVELMMQIGLELHDYDLVQAARMKALHTAFKAADKAFRKNTLAKLVTGPVESALAAFKLGTIVNYIVNKGFEHVVETLLGV